MLFINPFEDTRKSLLNISGHVIDIVINRKIMKFQTIIALVEP